MKHQKEYVLVFRYCSFPPHPFAQFSRAVFSPNMRINWSGARVTVQPPHLCTCARSLYSDVFSLWSSFSTHWSLRLWRSKRLCTQGPSGTYDIQPSTVYLPQISPGAYTSSVPQGKANVWGGLAPRGRMWKSKAKPMHSSADFSSYQKMKAVVKHDITTK